MDVTERFWNASLEELKRGFVQEEDHYVCLLCGEQVEKGIVYPEDGVFYEAGRYIRLHIERAHQSVFEHLIRLDKKFTGLSDHQNHLLRLFYEGKSDREVQEAMGIGSASTIRNHRFALKEKERQAKVFLVLMELLKEKDTSDRQPVTRKETEDEKILRKYFPEGTAGPLKTFALKEKQRLVVLREIAKRFEPGRIYDEKEVNQILKQVYPDYVKIRRYLIEYGFLNRKRDGSQYWLEHESKRAEGNAMDRRDELKQLYKEMKPQAGVYQIKNTINQKVFVGSTMNLKTLNGKRFELNAGSNLNKRLQEEWKEFGEDAFVIEVLEVLEPNEDGFFDQKNALEKLEEKWLAKLQPYGERGYNT
jgi:hypothetical protein